MKGFDSSVVIAYLLAVLAGMTAGFVLFWLGLRLG